MSSFKVSSFGKSLTFYSHGYLLSHSAWRHRLPNDYEDLTMWDEVFTWRSHMFNAITSNFHWSEPSTLATLHDRPWTAIRMSMTARKQGMRQVRNVIVFILPCDNMVALLTFKKKKTALLLLNKLTDNRAMDVSDAYLKLREQILSYNNPENDLERTGGLNLINTTNLSFFDPAQKSELFRLKAIFLASLRRTSKSNQGYCHSIQICPTHSKSWVSWGGLCSSLGTLTERQTEQLAMKSGSTEKGKESRAASAKKVAQYLAQAMGCYLEAVQINAHEKSRIHLPKCLWMLTKDGSSPGVLCQTLENRGTKLPPWVWLPWIPQLLTGLSRIEGRAIKAILSRLVKAYPQAVYYSLRAFYLERRDVERAKGISSSSGQHMASVAYAEEMMSTLRRSHTSLWSSLEAILEELIVKFRPSYEEELLATISALLERAESHSEKQCLLSEKSRVEDEDAMVASWSKTLSRIAAKFFRTSDSSSGTNRRDERVRKTAAFKRKYKADFENDFKVDAEGPPEAAKNEAKALFSLDEYITKLQAWKIKLEAQVACTPSSLPLIESSQSLAMFCGDIPDLWPGACDTKYLNSNTDHHSSEDDQPGRNQTSTSSSAAIARRAAHSAAVAAAAAAAKEGVGGEYGGGSVCIEIPGRYCPNSSASTDIRPSPELHAKLIRFEPFVEVLRRNDQLVRRVGMLGSDGRSYKFLLQFAIPYWTRTDERTAQTHYVIDKFLRQNCTSARNHLSVQPSAAIPVAQRLRMTLDVDSRIALDDVLRKHLERKNQKVESIASSFLKQVAQGLKEKVTDEMAAEEKKQIEKVVRLSAYHQTCNSKIEGDILLRHIRCAFDGPEPFFHFRRAVTGQLAANSLLQYVFSVAERTPPRLVILQSNARVLSPDFRVSYSNQGAYSHQMSAMSLSPFVHSLFYCPQDLLKVLRFLFV
jgi:transformation/transcription domain-associated protein